MSDYFWQPGEPNVLSTSANPGPTDSCGWPEGTVHPHVEQCHRAERERAAAELEALAGEFDGNVDWSAGRSSYGDNDAWTSAARALRALAERLRGGSDE